MHTIFHMKNNVFSWNDGLLDYLDPKNIMTPLVELPQALNPFADQHVRIFAKLLNTLPLTNLKSIPAFNMLNTVDLKDKHTIIENSSGNTVVSLAVIWKIFWIDTTKAFVSHEIAMWKLKLLQLFWVHPIINKEPAITDPKDKTSWIFKARELGQQDGWINPWQYSNEENPNAHYAVTWSQIYQQMEWNIQVFCAWLWTTGTMLWVSKFLKEKNKNVYSLWIIRKPNNPISWTRTRTLLKEVAFDRSEYVDETIEIGTKESYAESLKLIRHGIVVWPSSGFALIWVKNFIEEKIKGNTLDSYRNEKWEINVAFVCCDTPFPYIDEYFSYLDQDDFPEIENKELLSDKK